MDDLADDRATKPEPIPEVALPATGETVTGKRCVVCGVAGTTLAWRPSTRASSPLTEPKWWPTRPVYQARLTCRCGNTSYGWLIDFDPQGPTGEFLVASDAELLAGEFMVTSGTERRYW